MNKKEVRSLQNLIEDFLLRNKEKIVFSHKKGYRTFTIIGKELSEKVAKLRVFLKDKKIRRNDVVIILGNNSIPWVVVYFACILSGITVVPLDTLTDRALLNRIQKKVQSKAIFQDKGLASSKIKR